MRKLRVLFVAGLTPVPSGGWGGQLTVARTLYESGLAEAVDLFPLSSTQMSIPPPPLLVRLLLAVRRLVVFVFKIFTVDVALIFSSGGAGLLEKGLMCIFARIARRGVMVRFGSGKLPEQCNASRLMRVCMRLMMKSSHVVCTQGKVWTDFFSSFPEGCGKTLEIPNGTLVKPLPSGRKTLKPGPHLLYVGWLTREKGIFESLRIVELLRRIHPGIHLTLAGGGEDMEEFKTTVQHRGLSNCIHILGWVPPDHISHLLEQTDVFLFPSHFEGLPNAVLEAMAAGIPVVATRVGSIPDLIQDSRNGLLAEVGDIEGLTRAVSRLLCFPELQHEIGTQARKTIEDGYDMEKAWPLYAEGIRLAALKAHRPGLIHLTHVNSSVGCSKDETAECSHT